MPRYRPYSDTKIADEMLTITSERTGKRAFQRLKSCSRELGGLISQQWETNPILTVSMLRSGATLACLPSMLTRVQKSGQGKGIATEVTDNLRNFYDRILNSELSDISHVEKREDFTDIKGCMSELAILGTLWWSATDDKLPQGSYILPATKKQDQAYIQNGKRMGFDLILSSDTGVKTCVQVKSNRYSDGLPYHKDIPVIEPRDLLKPKPGTWYNPYVTCMLLMDAIICDDSSVLGRASEGANKIIFPANAVRAA